MATTKLFIHFLAYIVVYVIRWSKYINLKTSHLQSNEHKENHNKLTDSGVNKRSSNNSKGFTACVQS